MRFYRDLYYHDRGDIFYQLLLSFRPITGELTTDIQLRKMRLIERNAVNYTKTFKFHTYCIKYIVRVHTSFNTNYFTRDKNACNLGTDKG